MKLEDDLKTNIMKIKMVNKKVNQLDKRSLLMQKDIKFILKSLDGNGKTGLIEQVVTNTNWRYTVTGGLLLLSILCTLGYLNLGGVI